MFLERLILENVRCFDHLDISFLEETEEIRKRTIILGNNGVGKSTILKAIALIMAGSTGLGQLLGESDKWININKVHCTITAVISTAKKEKRTIKLSIHRGDSLAKIISRNEDSLDDLDSALEHTNRNYLTIGYGVSRRVGESSLPQKRSSYTNYRAENVATLFGIDSALHSLESWVMDMDYRKEEVGLTMVKSALNKLLSDYKFDSIDKEKRQLLFKTKQGLIGLSELSDGYKITANWLGDLLYRITRTYDDYKSPLNARFCLLIDEIGLHLHPNWQRQILISLNNLLPNAQIICTTHSPFVAQQAATGELFTLIQEKKKINLFQYNNDPRQLLIHQIVMSDIFGLSTDESVHVEKQKEDYRKAKEKRKKTGKPGILLKKRGLESKAEPTSLKNIPVHTNSRSQTLFNEDYNQLMEQLKQELRAKK